MKQLLVFLVLVSTCKPASSQDWKPYKDGKLVGYKTKDGVIKIKSQYDYGFPFFNNRAVVASGLNEGMSNLKVGVIDSNNNIIIPITYEVLRPLDTGIYIFGYREKYFGESITGVMREDQSIIIPAEYNYIQKYKGKFLVTKNKDTVLGRVGGSDLRGVTKTNGLLDSTGKILIDCRYMSINFLKENLLTVDTGRLSEDKSGIMPAYALFSVDGKQLTSFKYMVIGEFNDGLSRVRVGNLYGFIDTSGKEAIGINHDFCEPFQNGHAIIRKADKWGAINKYGKIVIELKHEYLVVKDLISRL